MVNTPINPTEQVELEAVQNMYWADKAEALIRLMDNDDFKSVVLQGYLKDHAIDKTSLLATDYVRSTNSRGFVMEELVAISAFENWMRMVLDKGIMPEDEDEG